VPPCAGIIDVFGETSIHLCSKSSGNSSGLFDTVIVAVLDVIDPLRITLYVAVPSLSATIYDPSICTLSEPLSIINSADVTSASIGVT